MSGANVQKPSDLGFPTKVHASDPNELRPLIEARVAAHFPERRHLRVVHIEVPSGAGVANETLLLDLEWDGGSGGAVMRIDTDDPLFIYPPFELHYRLYETVGKLALAPVPQMFWLELDDSLIGRPFFLMERMTGQVPNEQPVFHSAGWMHETTPAERRAMWRDTVEKMARLHQMPLEAVAFLERSQLGSSGLEQELNAALHYMRLALVQDRHPIVERAAEWLQRNLPANAVTGFSWGDARPQNVMYRDNRVVSLFDWDMASLAGPEADLAWWTVTDYSVTHARGISRIEGWGSPAETIALWEELSGRKLRDMEWHFVFAAFRNALALIKLAKMLDAKGNLPAQSAYLKDNNLGVQYLASMLDLPPISSDSMRWPGLGV